MAATYELTESPPVATPATALPSRSEALPLLPAAAVLSLQRTAGNQAVTAKLARADAGPKLRTALDSKLVVTPAGGGYSAALHFGEESVDVASYTPKGDTPINRLPVYLEDIVSGGEAVVNVRYDPAAADVKAAFQTREVDGVRITVRLQPQSAEELTVKSTNAAKQTGANSANVHGAENVQAHSGANATDMIMGSIASAEGGFASVEGTDAGVLTWGQGQWIVTNGELQKVLTFIKERRRDLFDKYWGAADLDVQGSDFLHDGKRWTKAKKDMLALFRPNAETIMAWANRFGQAGMDPQIQRLQREYLRTEVERGARQEVPGPYARVGPRHARPGVLLLDGQEPAVGREGELRARAQGRRDREGQGGHRRAEARGVRGDRRVLQEQLGVGARTSPSTTSSPSGARADARRRSSSATPRSPPACTTGRGASTTGRSTGRGWSRGSAATRRPRPTSTRRSRARTLSPTCRRGPSNPARRLLPRRPRARG